jgi:hypothetical protein
MLTRVADKEVEVSKTAMPAIRRPANKLSTPSRVTAYALGFAGLGAGGVAVFITHVEAGPVALLAVGLIFMIIALSGHLPTRLKIGENEAEWQEVAGEVIETAVEASPPSAKAELATQLGELAEVAPRAAAPALSGLAYENSIIQTIEEAANKIPDVQRVLTWVTLEEVGEFDFVIQATGNRFILVEVKASPRLLCRKLRRSWRRRTSTGRLTPTARQVYCWSQGIRYLLASGRCSCKAPMQLV